MTPDQKYLKHLIHCLKLPQNIYLFVCMTFFKYLLHYIISSYILPYETEFDQTRKEESGFTSRFVP